MKIARTGEKVSSILENSKSKDLDFISILKQLLSLMSNQSCVFSEEFLKDLQKYAPSQWKKIEKFRFDNLKTNFDLLYKIGSKNGFIKKNINKEIFYLIYSHALRNIMNPEVVAQLPFTTKEVTNSIIEVLLTGSLTEIGKNKYLK